MAGKITRRTLTVIGVIILIFVCIGIGAAIGASGKSSPQAAPAITKTVTVPGPTVTVTVTKRAKAPKPAGPGSVMNADGVYVVGTDIQPGTWHTTGAQGGSGGNCYVALLSSTNTSDIIDNANVTGPDTITVNSGVKAVQTSGCNAWQRIGP